MTNTEAARVLANLIKQPIRLPEEGRYINGMERLALEKAVKALRKLQSLEKR